MLRKFWMRLDFSTNHCCCVRVFACVICFVPVSHYSVDGDIINLLINGYPTIPRAAALSIRPADLSRDLLHLLIPL